MDWNNDGNKDLVAGERDGHIRLYINAGTNSAPVFNGYTFLEVASAPFDCGYNSMPVIVDWDEDGRKDLLCGEHDGKIFLLLNTNTDAAPVFTSTSFIQNGGSDLDIGGRTSPDVVDWDGDGKKDIIAGETQGEVFFLRNVGTNEAPAFNGHVLLQAGGSTIDVGYNSRPFAVDWNNDGVKDLICGCYDTNTATGFVWYYRARGPLSIDVNQLSVATGGTINFTIDAGAAGANRPYLLVGGINGTSPGTLLPGGLATLPINRDAVTNVILANLFTPIFKNYVGQLDASGQGAAQLNAPPVNAALAGRVLHHAWCLRSPFDTVSNPVGIEFLP